MVSNGTGKEGTHEVVSPLGEPVVNRITMAPRLNTLGGKTIGEIWNGGFRGDESFPMIERMLQERFPTVKLIPFTEFPLVTIASLHPERKEKTLQVLRDKMKEKSCDAAIIGNGC